MRQLITTLALTLCALTAANAQKFGHFDSGAFLQQMPEAKNVEKTLDAEATKIEAQLTTLQEDLKKQVDDYQKKASTMTEQQRAQKEQELQELQERIQTFLQTSRQQIQQKQAELMQPIMQKLLRAIQDVGADNGFTYIFERQAGLIIYNGPKSTDITPLVKKKLGIT